MIQPGGSTLHGGVRQAMPRVPPLDLLGLARRFEQSGRLRRQNGVVTTAVDHEQRTPTERTHALQRISDRTDERRERKVREISTRREYHRPHRAVTLRHGEREIRAERVAD